MNTRVYSNVETRCECARVMVRVMVWLVLQDYVIKNGKTD